MKKHLLHAAFFFAVVFVISLLPLFTASAQAEVTYPQTGKIKVSSVYMHETTNTKSHKIARLRKGDQVIVHSLTGSQYQITFERNSVTFTGYLGKKNITLTGATEVTEHTTTIDPASHQGKVICIDAGHQHGGDNSKEPIGPGSKTKKKKVSYGTRGVATGVPEYQLNLMVALNLQKELEARGYTVVMVRTSNEVNISNSARAKVANECNADAFIRIHANGSSDRSARGAETICMRKNNQWNGHLYDKSYALSQCIVDAMCVKTGIADKGVKLSNNMSGINWSQVPVTIVEMGYMSNKTEDKLMQTPEFQTNVVQGIADGLDIYFNR